MSIEESIRNEILSDQQLTTLTNNELSQQFTKRVMVDYTLLQQDIMKCTRNIILEQMEVSRLTGKSIIHENQDIIGSTIATKFINRKIINIMIVAKTQSGKTGSMCATIKHYLQDSTNLIPIENIYIITGLSSIEWKEQTKERMPESIQNRIFHRSELPNTFVEEIKTKTNILIIMDEIQVAAKKNQTIYKSFEAAGLFSKQLLYKNDVKIIEYTATPDGTIYDIMKWGDSSEKILADPGEGYIGAYELFRQNRVKQYKDLCGDATSTIITPEILGNINEIKIDIDRYDIPRYHIIRTKTGSEQVKCISNFKVVFSNTNLYEYIKYDRESDVEDINKTLKVQPNKHTFIFIKEMLRCAKTLKKQYLGVLYDRYTDNPDDATIIQGLIGRCTGYDDNGVSIIYTNIGSVERYEKLWRSKFDDKSTEWNSKTTKYKNGMLQGGNTFNDTKFYDGFSDAGSESSNEVEPVIKKFGTQEEAKEYYKKLKSEGKFSGNGPNKKKPNEQGFYEANIRGIKRVYSCDEIFKERRCNIENGAGYGFRPCYANVLDKTTLEWWMIHY